MKYIFSDCLLRLKEQAKTHSDKEIAELLGLSDKAFTARKARDAFPVNHLYALSAKRPDLHIDVEYVLGGIPGASMTLIKASRKRVERMFDAGLPIEKIRENERGHAPESVELARNRLLQLSAVEVAAINTILESMLRNRVS